MEIQPEIKKVANRSNIASYKQVNMFSLIQTDSLIFLIISQKFPTLCTDK